MSVLKRFLFLSLALSGVMLLSCACKKPLTKPINQDPPVVSPPLNDGPPVDYWLTRADQSALLQKQSGEWRFSEGSPVGTLIEVDDTQQFQEIDGFGYTLTGGSATLINQLSQDAKEALLNELFSTSGPGIGVSYLRISIGASDLSAAVFTYNELPYGETDLNLEKFSIEPELKDLIPVLKRILEINPKIKIMGSPWTAPTWMKTNLSFKGGSLRPLYYDVYARYLATYVQVMKSHGIPIDALTIQNEPLHSGNNPSMYMEAAEQATFIKTALGPTFKAAKIDTKIIIYDHNADRPEYPLSILADQEAYPYIDGSAFHLYGGQISALSTVHHAYPDKKIYFTEQWVGGPSNFAEDLKWHLVNVLIGATRNWSRNVLEWNLAADAAYKPHTEGGCSNCLGALTITPSVQRNVAYYVIAHASKFVPAGSKRIHSSLYGQLANVAFKTPEGKNVLIVMNTSPSDQTFHLRYKNKTCTLSVPAGAAATFTWAS